MLRALITGITGQDGAYLAELLLAKGYEVHGIVRRDIMEPLGRVEHLRSQLCLHQADLLDMMSIIRVINNTEPREIYNLAAQSFIPTSWDQPLLTSEFTGLGVIRILEAIRIINPAIRFFQASSSEVFGDAREEPQNEETPFRPLNPYGISKAYGHWITANYRRNCGLFACSGILYNHESPRRGKEFVTRKITDGVARIKLGLTGHLCLGQLDSQRDWGYAGDYVRPMWLMLQQDEPRDYVIASGVKHTVRDWVERAFSHVGLDWHDHVLFDESLVRQPDINTLCGDTSRARRELGWIPAMSFDELVMMMVDADLDCLQSE
ncbi:MAG: GDP-mannose 4,6-dehydratase [Pirellulales bacterium]|nr:GDP-mannose 4,6-dehydratase [Pirellulales bacterium]